MSSGPSTVTGSGKPPPSRPITATTKQCRPAGSRHIEFDDDESGDTLEAANIQLNKNLRELTQTYRTMQDDLGAIEATLVFVEKMVFVEKILETLQEPLVLLTRDLRVKVANTAFYRIFQHKKEETEGRGFFSIGNGQWDSPRTRELFEQVLPNNEHVEGFELTQDFSGMGLRTLQLNFRRLEDEQLILLSVQDITPFRQIDSLRHRENSLLEEVGVRRRLQEQLLANDRQKNQFLGLLGHELRNPLTVMRNSIQTLVAEEHAFVSDPRISEALALLERQSRHMTHLVNDLLDITRINNGKVVLKRERVSLPRCLDEVLAAHRSTLASRELKFSVDKPESPIYLDADAARLFQVIDNLVTNAIKFTQPGGRIHVDMKREGGKALIRVSDTGIGIPAESLDTLFDPFTQVDNSLACHGLGLGLSLVKSLVDLHGGDIRAYSDGEDKGSQFVIHWPLHRRQDDSASDAAPPALHLKASIRPQRILVVDDIADIADSFARLLEVAGHDVVVAYDAEQGLQLARRHCPTVAFLDMVMPDTDGLQLAQQLRQEFAPEDLTLVVVSGYGHSEDIERARSAGFEHHLLKPIEVQQVYNLLDSLIGDLRQH